MPIIRDIRLSLKTKELLRREGIKDYFRLPPEIKSLIRELRASVNNEHLLVPAIAYEIYTITKVDHHQLCLEGNAALHDSLLPSLLLEAKELAVVVYTIGPKLEKEVTDYFRKKEPLRGLLLDGIGSAAMDSLTQEVCKLMAHEALSRGYQASSPLSPGAPDFSISKQWQLFKLVPAEEIGVSLTPSGMMVPCKSVSMVVGMGLNMPTWTQAEICAHCSLQKTCPYKVGAEHARGIKLKLERV